MRSFYLSAIVIAAAALSGSGVKAAPAADHGCIAVRDGYQHIAATTATPTDCCAGRLQCSQFLSTTTVVRPSRDQHT